MSIQSHPLKSLVARHKDGFLGHVLTLASGTGLAQLVTLAAAPVISRLFSPAEFGILAVLVALTMPLIAISALKFELAVLTARNTGLASNALALGLAFLAATVTLSALVVFYGNELIASQLGTQAAAAFLWFVPLGVLAGGLQRLGSFWAIKQTRLGLSASAEAIRASSTAAGQIGLGLAGLGPAGLIIGHILGLASSAGLLMITIIRRDISRIRGRLSAARMRATAHQFKDFAIFQTPKALLNAGTKSLPPILLAISFDPVIAGLYWFGHRLLMMPMTLLGSSVNRIFLKVSAGRKNAAQETFGLWVRVTLAMALLGAIGCLVLTLSGPQLFAAVFGESWREAGHYAAWISVWIMVLMAAIPAQSIFIIHNRQPLLLVLELIYLIPRLMVIPLAAQWGTARDAVAWYSLAGVAFNLSLIGIAGFLCFTSSASATRKINT